VVRGVKVFLKMATSLQSTRRKRPLRKVSLKYTNPTFSRTPILKKCPQAKGIVTKVTTMSPKKPNSAVRHVAKIDLNNSLRLTARLPGRGYLCSKYNRVLVEGGRANDLPGVGYTAIRGVFDFSAVVGKKKRRSVYGVDRPSGYSKHVRRCFRK
jgi:small subunit ribosomal protein S12